MQRVICPSVVGTAAPQIVTRPVMSGADLRNEVHGTRGRGAVERLIWNVWNETMVTLDHLYIPILLYSMCIYRYRYI